MKFQKSSPCLPLWKTIKSINNMISVDNQGNLILESRTGKFGDIYYRMVLDTNDIEAVLQKLEKAVGERRRFY